MRLDQSTPYWWNCTDRLGAAFPRFGEEVAVDVLARQHAQHRLRRQRACGSASGGLPRSSNQREPSSACRRSGTAPAAPLRRPGRIRHRSKRRDRADVFAAPRRAVAAYRRAADSRVMSPPRRVRRSWSAGRSPHDQPDSAEANRGRRGVKIRPPRPCSRCGSTGQKWPHRIVFVSIAALVAFIDYSASVARGAVKPRPAGRRRSAWQPWTARGSCRRS